MPDLILLLGDHLDLNAPLLQDVDPAADIICMAEVKGEAEAYPNHKQRVAVFFSAMRHVREALRERGFRVEYQEIGDEDAASSLDRFLGRMIERHQPDRVYIIEPGEYRLLGSLSAIAKRHNTPLEFVPDTHFLCTHDEFNEWASGRKTLTMEYFYREMRKRYGYLVTPDGKPEGGAWNYDQDNRESFGKDGPGQIKAPIHFQPDAITKQVFDDIEAHVDGLYGSLDAFAWPVTHEEAQRAVRDFIEHRLPHFGTYQDAMWTGRPFLYHSRISVALNLKLIDPRYVVEKAIEAYEVGHAPLNAVEGFVRQVIGWREFIRGVYWRHMPGYNEHNALEARRDLPDFFWTGETHMVCMRQTVSQLLEHAYAHHIQRLMVTGLFALLYGVQPRQIHDWYMALYIDSIEWVTLPNTVGMSQYADGGIVGTKPYIASGQYISRQSNYCASCRYHPKRATGDDACPFTTLYWSFIDQHAERLKGNRRMEFQVRNLERKSAEERQGIAERAEWVHRAALDGRL
ncbi:MAG: cryptochrome/photolyase family protein [Rhodothermales bacterium]